MADRTTVNITKRAHKAAKQDKEDDESWSDWFERKTSESDDFNADGESIPSSVSPSVEHSIGEDVSQALEYQRKTIEELQQQRDMLTEVLSQVHTLDASERAKIAREVEERLR
jgi:hypothetical protein